MKKRSKTRRTSAEADHDHVFRGFYSVQQIAEKHLRNALHQDLLDEMALEAMTLESESYVDSELKAQFSDVVWKCPLRSSGAVHVTFLFEHKSELSAQPIFIQLLQYLLGIWKKDLSEKRDLTFVVPVIVYHGQREWSVRPFWEYFSGFPTVLRRFLPEFDYILTDLGRTPTEVIKAKEGLGALRSLYLAFKYAFDESALKGNFRDILIFVGKSGNPYLDELLTEMVFTYVQKRLLLEPLEIIEVLQSLPDDSKTTVMSTYDKIIQLGVKQGIQQGVQQGIEEATYLKNKRFVTSLLQNTDWDDERIAYIAGVEIEFIQHVRDEMKKEAAADN